MCFTLKPYWKPYQNPGCCLEAVSEIKFLFIEVTSTIVLDRYTAKTLLYVHQLNWLNIHVLLNCTMGGPKIFFIAAVLPQDIQEWTVLIEMQV